MHTRHQWIAAALAVAALAGGAQAARAQLAQKFVTPLGGVPYQDWSIVNYIDLDSSSGVQDWHSGSPAYTYDGHDAIDFTLANFAEMEAGIEVYAAAAGTVTEVVGDRYDYCTAENPCSTGTNYITIDHGGGLVTQYLHLARIRPW